MMSNYDRANRLRAIATNAVREARIAYGRDDKPWIDDDAARAENIFQMLFLTELELVDGNMEHFPLVPKGQPQIEAAVRKVADVDRKSTRLNSSHTDISRMPSSA